MPNRVNEATNLLLMTECSMSSGRSTVWFMSLAEKIRKEGFPPLGFHLLLGSDFQAMAQNQGRNLQEGRIVLGQVVARKQVLPTSGV